MQDYTYTNDRGREKTVVGAISGVFSNEKTLGGIKLSFLMSAIAAALACVIVVVACNYFFNKRKSKLSGIVLEYSLLFPWLLPTILICYSYRTYFNSNDVWYVGNTNLYSKENVRFLIIMAYTVTKLPIILPSVLAVFALNFNALFTEYDMSATFQSPQGITYAMVIQGMLADATRGANMNALGRRCASTVFIMVVSGIVLYLVYGVGSRDLGERLEIRKRRRERWEKLFGKKEKKEADKEAV